MAILRKLPAAVAVAALTATLVGCGTQSVKDDRDEARMERDEAQAALEQTQSDLDQAQSDLEAAQAAKTAAEADAAAAAQAQMEADAAAAAAAQAQMEADAAAAAAEQARMDEEADRMAAEDAQQTAEDALAAVEKAAADAAAKAASATAKMLLDVLEDADVNQHDPDGDSNFTDVHVPPAPTVSVSTDGMLMAAAPNVRGYTAGMTPDMIEGWRGATLMNAEGDTATIYSDIGNDGTETLLDRYRSELPTSTVPRTWTIGPPLTTADADVLEDNAELIQWSSVTRPDAETMVSGGTPEEPKLTFQGFVHNIPGTFSCEGTGCVAPSRFSDGTVQNAAGVATNPPASSEATANSSHWTFVPDEGVSTYTDDTSYLVFGWWISKGPDGMPDDLTLITPSAMGLGAMRTEASTTGDSLRGSATYKGAAAGKYAIASLSSDMHEGGHFTAMATLMADFDADSTPETVPNAVVNDRLGIALSGTIDNFMTGDVSRPNWMVTLTADGNALAGAQAVDDLGSDIANTDTQTPLTTEWSTGGAQKGTGEWTAMFYGGADDLAANTSHPVAAVGTFNAHIGTDDADTGAVGRLQGAFAVNKM